MRVLRRLASLLLCALALASFADVASARPAHKSAVKPHLSKNAAELRPEDRQPYPMAEELAKQKATRARGVKAPGKANRFATAAVTGGFSTNSLVSEARKYLGTNPTGRARLWCGAFMDLVFKRTGHAGGGNLASAYAKYGTRVSGPQVGAIAVMRRAGGGHVGVVSGIDPNGNPIIISGNHNRTTAESVYPASRITAYVVPGG